MRRQWLSSLAALALGGCASVGSILEGAERPTVDLVGAQLQSIGLDRSTVAFDVKIHNPYDFALPLLGARYGISSEGEEFLSGEADLSGEIPAGGDRTLTIPATVVYRDLLAVLEQVRPGHVIPYIAQLSLAVDVPGGERLDIPLSKAGELPIPALPKVEVTRVEWRELGVGGASGTLHITFENTNQFPIDIEGFDYSLSLGGHRIATTHLGDELSLARGGSGAMAIEIEVPSTGLASALIGLLRNGRVEYDLAGALGVSTPFGNLTMPLEERGQTVVASKDSK